MNINISNEYAQVTMYTPVNGTMVRKDGRTKIQTTMELDKLENEEDYLELMNSLQTEYYSFMTEQNSRNVKISMTSQLINRLLYHQPVHNYNEPSKPKVFGKDVNELHESGLKFILEVSWPTVL